MNDTGEVRCVECNRFDFECAGLTRAICSGESSGTPWATTFDFFHSGGIGCEVTNWDVVDTVMSEEGSRFIIHRQ